MTMILYWEHPVAEKWQDCYVIDSGTDKRGSWIELDSTIFHVHGGGQPADRGFIGDLPIVDVRRDKDSNAIRHYYSEARRYRVGEEVEIRIDCERRITNSSYHSGGHLLAHIAEKLRPDLRALGGHHYPGEARIEFSVSEGLLLNEEKFREELNIELSNAVRDILPVHAVRHTDGTRYVQIGQFRPVGCGGTHVLTSGDLARVYATKVSHKKGVLRVSYEVGETPLLA